MAIPHARKIVVGGVTYGWSIQAGKDRYRRRFTPRHLRLLLQPEGGHVRFFDCLSKLWTEQDEYDEFEGGIPSHKATFGPGQVRQVIEGLPVLNWTVAEQV
jgi:hypothetical protein